MKLLVIVLTESKAHLEEILQSLSEHGVSGATVIDAVGMGRLIYHETPIFMGLRSIVEGNLPYNKVIFSVVGDDLDLGEIRRALEDKVGSLNEPGTGIMFTVPVEEGFGSAIEKLG